MNIQNSPIEKVSTWIKKSITLKLITITFLMLLLLIPTSMVDSIIGERQYLRGDAIDEVSSKWANQQKLSGPILSIPVLYEYINEENIINTYTKLLHILPEELNINGDISPKKLKRGIYEIIVYNSKLKVNGSFKLNQSIDSTYLKKIKYDDAFLTFGISDLRGIQDEIKIKWNNEYLSVIPGSRISDITYSGITSELPDLSKNVGKTINFSMMINLQGSKNMSFVPLGNTTEVKLTSNWPSPSFMGSFLPDEREISETGFTAYWKVLQLNRNIPESWIGDIDKNKIHNSSFGVNLILDVDDYQKTMRSSKYAVMTIALTFLIFFLVEIINGRKIHPFQYALVGLALCLFYILLISISEHSDFNFAYFISSTVIVSMISIYSLSVFKSLKLTLLLLASLTGTYGFLYTTLQLSDYALLMGSIGLTLILATTMYFTRNINWYKINSNDQ